MLGSARLGVEDPRPAAAARAHLLFLLMREGAISAPACSGRPHPFQGGSSVSLHNRGMRHGGVHVSFTWSPISLGIASRKVRLKRMATYVLLPSQ